jgi:hypothetical protein
VEGEVDPATLERSGAVRCLLDVEGRTLLLFQDDFWLRYTVERHSNLRFIAAVQPGRGERAAA